MERLCCAHRQEETVFEMGNQVSNGTAVLTLTLILTFTHTKPHHSFSQNDMIFEDS